MPLVKRTTYKRRPYVRRKLATTTVRRPYKKYKRSNYRKYRIMYSPTAIPDKMRVKLSFGTAQAVSTIGGAVSQIFRVVACASPFYGSGYSSALQPQAFDQWANMYFTYRPLAMSVKHNFAITNEATGVQCVYMRGYWSSAGSGLASDTHVINNRYTKTRYLNADSSFKQLKSYSNLRNVVGASRVQWMTNDGYSALVTANPALQVSYFLHITTVSGSIAMNGQLETQGEIWYEFSNPRHLIDA